MKNDIRLHIQDDEGVYHMLDLYEDENMTLVDSIQDVKDIKKIYQFIRFAEQETHER